MRRPSLRSSFPSLPATLAGALLAASALPAQLPAQIAQGEYKARRDAVAAGIQDGIVLVLGAPEPHEDYLAFFQTPSLNYLTGFEEPNAALIMVKRGGTVTSTLFVPPRSPAAEVWTGARMGTDGAARLTGMAARATNELRPALDSVAKLGLPLYVVGEMGRENATVKSPDRQLVDGLRSRVPGLVVHDANALVARLRGRKSPAEQALIRKAVEITVAAHREAMRALEPGMNEFEIQALIEYTFRRRGADRTSFASIVGSGPNSTTLHYNRNDRFMQPGDVVVMDIGASALGYAADVTRTLPVSGTFSPAQREIYQVVRDAQAAAERQAKPGANARLMDDSSRAVVANGLARLGLIESASATYDCGSPAEPETCAQHRLYYMHGLGHGIGLEVHDPEQYYFTNIVAPGSAFTIEPGIYVRGNTLEIISDTPRNRQLKAKIANAVARYANIGVRIEDDYLVTDQGLEWISRAPREIAEIEALMKEPWSGPAARDAAVVEWYRGVRR